MGPHGLIHVTFNTVSCNAPREKSSRMPYTTLTVLCIYFLGSSSNCIQQGHLLIGTVIINLPPQSTEELLYGIQKWGICWKELQHHLRVYCKPLIDKARMVERHIVPDDDEEWHARPQQPGMPQIWHRTPSLEMAAHMVMLAPLCPGTVTVALYPMRFLPRLLTLQRLKPASST